MSPSIEKLTWTLDRKQAITSAHYRYFFSGATTKNILPGINYVGKYFTLHHLKSNIKRNYCLYFIATEKLYPGMLQLMDAVERNEEFLPPFEDINTFYRDGIELFIKKKDNFSKTIAELPLRGENGHKEDQCKFHIEGPYGVGLRLSPSPKGLIVAVICGTGVLMWLEVVSYMLRKAVYEYGKCKLKNYKIFKNETFDDLTEPNFRLILFSSFNNAEEAVGMNEFQRMSDIMKRLGLNIFEYYIRLSNKKTPHYTEEYFKGRINGNPEKIYLCGPQNVAPTLKEIFVKIGFSEAIFNDI